MGAGKTLNSLRGNLNKNCTTGNCIVKKANFKTVLEIRPTGGRLTGGPPVTNNNALIFLCLL